MEKSDWNLKKYVYSAELSVDELINSIRVFEVLKGKYPNDEFVDGAIEILRDEICKMFGGTICYEDTY
jgi:hypothetical protein